MLTLIDFVVVLAAGFFISRWLGRSGRFSAGTPGVFAVHAASAAIVIVAAVGIKQLFAGIMPQHLVLAIVAQAIWLGWDLLRNRQPATLD